MEKKRIKGIITGVYRYGNNLIFRIGKRTKVSVPYKNNNTSPIYDYLGLAFEGEGIVDKYYGGKFKNFIKIKNSDYTIKNLNINQETKIENLFKAVGLSSFYEYLTKENRNRKSNYLSTFVKNPFLFVEKGKIDFLTALAFFYLTHGKFVIFPLFGTPAALSWHFWECYNEERKKQVNFHNSVTEIENKLMVKFPEPQKIRDYCEKNGKLVFLEKDGEVIFYDWKFWNITRFVYEFLDRYLPENLTNQPLINPDIDQVAQRVEEQKITVITGKGGTGKSTLLLMLKDYLNKKGREVLLTGTTGNAASILQGITASKAFDTFNHLKKEKPPAYFYDIIAIDEASMLDTVELHQILKKLRPHQKLIFSGDPEQLPPVRGENIFAEIVKRAETNGSIILLTKERRFSPTKKNILYIFQNYKQLLWGFSYAYLIYLNKTINNIDPQDELSFLSSLPLVITPFHRTDIGTKKINHIAKTVIQFLKNQKNPQEFFKTVKEIINKDSEKLNEFYYEKGDVVMLTQNVYNGNKILAANKEKALVEEVYEDQKEVLIYLPKRNTYLRTKLNNIAPAYAVEFFTAQGSESNYSFIFLPAGFVNLLTSNIKNIKAFNMASTRAKEINFFLTTENCNINVLKKITTFDVEKKIDSELIFSKFRTLLNGNKRNTVVLNSEKTKTEKKIERKTVNTPGT